jgi:uncharacterized membrane protein
MIKYEYAFVALPLMFLGSLVGVLLNRWLPSVALVCIIIGVSTHSLPKIFRRFKEAHGKETQELLMHH